MASYLIKLLGFIIFSLFILLRYYDVPFHNESGAGYIPYIITILMAYGVYKYITMTSKKPKTSFSPLSIGLYALLHIMILCFVYFGLVGGANGGLILFLKIFGYLLFPLVIVLVTYSLGNMALRWFVPSIDQEESAFRFLLSLGFGFVKFISALVILGIFGLYNIWSVFGILSVMGILAHREILATLKSLWTYRIEFPAHKPNGTFFEQINLPLISTEMLFLILTYLISVSFINIIRPMPIGWDDLGVYMNYPQIMANNGTILKGMSMAAWQVFTGIGFMFHSAPLAFFFNQVGGILSVIVLTVAFGSLLNFGRDVSAKRLSFINLPLLGATMFYAMPMVIFQQAKDMKLDPGLFFISVIGIYGMIYLLLRYRESLEGADIKPKEDFLHFFSEHKNLAYVLILGTIVGLAFTIKFTTLMLILGALGLIFYSKLGLVGFFGFFSAFVGVFTKAGLWTQLNVNYPKDDANFLLIVTGVSITLAVLFFAIAFFQHRAVAFKKTFLVSLIFLMGVGLTTLPWIAKNISEIGLNNLSIIGILGGKSESLIVDYTKIYSADELKKIEDATKVEAMSASGKSQNEDLGRYFGYEDGVNNYLRLPLNLTMQSNQPGEYTEITPFYLMLIPIIFLFLAYKNPFWILGLVAMLGFEYAYFFSSSLSPMITNFFATKDLPGGYLYIAIASFLPLVYFSLALKKKKRTELFLLNLVFASFYVFLFVIAAYGIVWYGIAMYFSFLLAILIGGSYITKYDEEKGESKKNIIRFFGSIIFLGIVCTYFFASAIPHGWNNLRGASFNEFKSGILNQEEGIFASHPDYFSILATLNIENQKEVFLGTMANIQNPTLKKLLESNLGSEQSLGRLEQILREVGKADLAKLGLNTTSIQKLRNEASTILTTLYKTILYPQKELRNTAGIYRIGTFLTYFIDNNRSRYYEDSLIDSFDKYFYDADPNKTVERMEKMGLKYFLVDLNAATIDKDPRHDLTRRFENLLKTFRSDKLELVQTDSICLQIALEEKDPATYMTYAGVNYESYKKDEQGVETSINRGQKQFECYNHILELIKENKIDDKHYSYLLPFTNYLRQNPPKDQQEMAQLFQNYVGHGWLVLFKIK